MSSLFGVPGPRDDEFLGFPPGGKPLDILKPLGVVSISQFQKKKRAKKARIGLAGEEALELRRRIGSRGGERSTLLAGRSTAAGTNVFKRNLGGTNRVTR